MTNPDQQMKQLLEDITVLEIELEVFMQTSEKTRANKEIVFKKMEAINKLKQSYLDRL